MIFTRESHILEISPKYSFPSFIRYSIPRDLLFKFLFIQTMDSELDPDPQLGKMLDPDPHEINADPHPGSDGSKSARSK